MSLWTTTTTRCTAATPFGTTRTASARGAAGPTPPAWDAVGRRTLPDGAREWLLVEAKAHVNELNSECKASSPKSLETIQRALASTQAALGVEGRDWLRPYYQYANRLAVLSFLESQCERARLVCIYFTGDSNPHQTCPRTAAEWQPALTKVKSTLGITREVGLSERLHDVFVSVVAP